MTHERLSGWRQRYVFLPAVVLLAVMSAEAQELRRTAFSFLNGTPAARIAGLGRVNVSLTDRDPTTFLSNPATVGDSLSGTATLNYQFYVADIGHSAFTYAGRIGKLGPAAFGVQHFSYGHFDGYDPSGAPLGDFSASETAITISKAHQIENFRLGIAIKGVFGSIAGMRSSALAFDIGGVFVHPDKRLTAGLVVKNAGFVLSDFTSTSDSALPIDVQFGATFKPEHMPVRFSLTAYRLVQSKAVEYTQNQPGQPAALQKVLRHFNFAAELLLHRNVNVLLGYNYGTHQELKLEDAGGSAGLSYGFSARIRSVEFTFSRSTFVSATAGYTFSLAMNVERWLKRN